MVLIQQLQNLPKYKTSGLYQELGGIATEIQVPSSVDSESSACLLSKGVCKPGRRTRRPAKI